VVPILVLISLRAGSIVIGCWVLTKRQWSRSLGAVRCGLLVQQVAVRSIFDLKIVQMRLVLIGHGIGAN
jgi:hypothetical protein